MQEGQIAQDRTGLYDPRFEHDSCGVGFIAKIDGTCSHETLRDAITMLERMEHRGARGAEENTGDGAGVLTQIPHEFLRSELATQNIDLGDDGSYAVGMLFLPANESDRNFCESVLSETISEQGFQLIATRDVPTDNTRLGDTAKRTQPFVKQVFISRAHQHIDDDAFERKLFVLRRWAKEQITRANAALAEQFYFSSLSTKTIVYKGMLTCDQVRDFYPDLSDERFTTALALVHSRFSTNTFPNWNRAQPLRFIAHNGEINTLRGNVNWMQAREGKMRSSLFGDDLAKAMHVIDDDASDSGAFDNALEFFSLAGRDLPHAMMMMVPEPIIDGPSMTPAKRAFYDYHSCLIEPWDGPASITFTDGVRIGALLDRNGLRPSRFWLTKDGRVIMASEVGVLDVDQSQIIKKGRLQPGKMFLVDTAEGRIIEDAEIKERFASEKPYAEWLRENLIHINDLPAPPIVNSADTEGVMMKQKAFGYTEEELRIVLRPMAEAGAEPIGSMGNDTPLAVMSRRPQLLYNYFKQLFAQVTNPPIDAIREELVTSTDTMIGPEGNILEPGPECARQIRLNSFVVTNEEVEKLRLLGDSESIFGKKGFRSITIPMLFDREHGVEGLEWALDTLCHQTSEAIKNGYDIFILSDRQMSEYRVPIPALLAVSAVHNHLIREGTRTQVGFVLESGEPREVHHFALLLGYGATAINPYVAFDSIQDDCEAGRVDIPVAKAHANYIKSINKGVVKVLSKMGISTVQSYLGAQVFEALGLAPEFVDRYFTKTVTRLGGIGLAEIAQSAIDRHTEAFFPTRSNTALQIGGQYQWRAEGESHLFEPGTVHSLQRACRRGDYAEFKKYSSRVNEFEASGATIRGLFQFKASRSIELKSVEAESAILKRFKTGAVSYGSISKEAHEAMAIAMNRVGGKSNTGEGGEDSERFETLANGDSKRSRIKQVASGRFGVTSHYLVSADEIQIKVAQGAKPGEGGQLPGSKVYPWIAETRYSTPGVGLISPPPHHDIYSIEDLAQLIFDLKNANSRARISVKLVAEAGVGTVAAGVAKAKADVILISGYDGGTGASPLSSIKHAGIPWEIGLAETHQTLMLNRLRGRVRLETDGQLKTGRDVVIAAMLGAEEFGFSTAPLVTLGCIMMRVCHVNTCPVGVATQDPQLREKFTGKPEYVENFMRFIAREVREILAELGFRSLDEVVGRTDLLNVDESNTLFAERGLDLKAILDAMPKDDTTERRFTRSHPIDLSETLDRKILIDYCAPAIDAAMVVTGEFPVRNTDRSVGTKLGSAITQKHGGKGLPDGTVRLHFRGSAGQSFGAFIPKGVSLTLEGDANDYLGKGLSGGRIVVFPPRESTFAASENVIVGNTVLYGATSGEAFVSGIAGERFAVRNSGASAVVEGVGDHGCEYMTGGTVVVLGQVGKNFAAGMSGGVAYIFDPSETTAGLINRELVDVSEIDPDEEAEKIRLLIERHTSSTGSFVGADILHDWEQVSKKFIKVIPTDYRRVIELQNRFLNDGLTSERAAFAAFESMNATA